MGVRQQQVGVLLLSVAGSSAAGRPNKRRGSRVGTVTVGFRQLSADPREPSVGGIDRNRPPPPLRRRPAPPPPPPPPPPPFLPPRSFPVYLIFFCSPNHSPPPPHPLTATRYLCPSRFSFVVPVFVYEKKSGSDAPPPTLPAVRGRTRIVAR